MDLRSTLERSRLDAVEKSADPTSPMSTDSGWVMPSVLIVSVAVHAAIGAVLAFMPVADAASPSPCLVTFEAAAPEPITIPEPEPVVESEPVEEAASPTPAPRRRQPRPRPAPETNAEPPPPAPVMTAAASSAGAEFSHPAGEEGGEPGGTPGGTGSGPVGAEGGDGEGAPTGLSRTQLRARLRGYLRELSGLVMSHANYPLAARREHIEGDVRLMVRLGRDGHLIAARVARSSGSSLLDDAALASIQSIDTLPAPPAVLPWEEAREIPLPVGFRLR